MWGATTTANAAPAPQMTVNASMPNVSSASEPPLAQQPPPHGAMTLIQPNGPGQAVFVPSSLQNLPTTSAAASLGHQPLLNGGAGHSTGAGSGGGGGVDPNTIEELQELIDEMRSKDYDSIRFATYRTACKLRFVQTKTRVHLVDVWNTIESFRENGLNAMAGAAQLKISRLELLLTSMFHNLNKRLPTTQHIDTHKSIAMLLGFLLSAYDKQQLGRITIFAVKVALVTMCAGKMADKLRYIFSQISFDSTGLMDYDRFAEYLQAVLRLPHAVFESPTFYYSPEALQQCFGRDEHVNVNQFLDAIMGDACPPCLMWLPLLHRMASVEHVYHPVVCDACQVTAFTGFRYKCQRCTNYQLCQSCFWRGRTSQWHTNEHEMKEYSSYKSPTKQLAHSIQKSLQCIPLATGGGEEKPHQHRRELFPTKPQRPLDLTNIVPMTPNTLRHHRQGVLGTSDFIGATPGGSGGGVMGDLTSRLRLPGQYALVNGGVCDIGGTGGDDEHRLIARYAAKLAGRTTFQSPSKLLRRQQQQREKALHERAVIARLEEENAEMARELAVLEQQQSLGDNSAQLSGLRERTAELEARMREKQAQRRELMQQLEQLMSQLHTSHAPMMTLDSGIPMSGSAGTTGSMSREHSLGFQSLGLGAIRGISVGTTTAAAQLQGDLLQAADAITANMGHLVKELDEAVDSPEESSMRGGGREGDRMGNAMGDE